MSTSNGDATTQVDLSNCDREPIHIPGSVQPHGALLAFDGSGRLVAKSQNASEFLGTLPEVGQTMALPGVEEEVARTVERALRESENGKEPTELNVLGSTLDAIWHVHDNRTILEFESQQPDSPELHTFAQKARQSLSRIQRTRGVDDLLDVATAEIRDLTGFDRVMCYRFRHDHSGEVVTELRRPDLESFLGLRYPATDIPAQARRLYVANPLRFIADVTATPVPLVPDVGPESANPLDLSHCLLRSTSPIHLEYLSNMGVTASMSVSIVVDGALWGLFACHHYSGPKWVAQAVRLACQLLSDIVSVLVAQRVQQEHRSRVEESRKLSNSLIMQVGGGDDMVLALTRDGGLEKVVTAMGVGVALDGRIERRGSAPDPTVIAKIIEGLESEGAPELFHTQRLGDRFPELDLGATAGMLAARFHGERDGWIFWFRDEEIGTVRWGGNPHRTYAEGPSGSRLTPRGSFSEYREQVRGQSAPWTEAEREVGDILRVEVQRLALQRASEVERARELMVAALSHDLRSPLTAIGLSAEMLRNELESPENATKMISSSTRRMGRLVEQMLDFSRLQAGLPLRGDRQNSDVAQVVREITSEAKAAYPGLAVDCAADGEAIGYVDPDRFAQVVSNLLNNARHHGDLGKPVAVRLEGGGDQPLVLEVQNSAPPIPEDIQRELFKPFKSQGLGKTVNPRGLGIGLYIVSEIVKEHEGTIHLRQDDGLVCFVVTIPASPAS